MLAVFRVRGAFSKIVKLQFRRFRVWVFVSQLVAASPELGYALAGDLLGL